jgi:hypothetical protein
MPKLSAVALAIIGSAALVTVFFTDDAQAVIQFKREFDRKYVDPDGRSPNQRALAAAALKAKCYVCHMDEDKKVHNAYGAALAELLDKDEDKQDREKIRAALEKVAEMRSATDSDDAPTFGDIIRAGELPSGYQRVEDK